MPLCYQKTLSHSPENVWRAKPVLLLIHGGALSHRMYRDQIPLLQDFDVIAPDLLGHGESVSLGSFNFSHSAELLREIIEDLKSTEPRFHQRIWAAIGVSLGGQVTLDLISKYPDIVDTAIVSGVSIAPPDDQAQWEMPHMPTSKDWIAAMMEDVGRMGGMAEAQKLQAESLAYQFSPPDTGLPPVLVLVGQDDTAMAKRDFDTLCEKAKRANSKSQCRVLDKAWHNHPIDVPERFAKAIIEWLDISLVK